MVHLEWFGIDIFIVRDEDTEVTWIVKELV